MFRSRRAFERLVEEALRELPEAFRPYLGELPVVVADWASEELLDEMGLPEDEDLYGVYLGTPLPERNPAYPELPGRIVVFRGPLEEDFPEPEELRRQVTVTVLHELAHHFGIPDARLEELGWG